MTPHERLAALEAQLAEVGRAMAADDRPATLKLLGEALDLLEGADEAFLARPCAKSTTEAMLALPAAHWPEHKVAAEALVQRALKLWLRQIGAGAGGQP